MEESTPRSFFGGTTANGFWALLIGKRLWEVTSQDTRGLAASPCPFGGIGILALRFPRNDTCSGG